MASLVCKWLQQTENPSKTPGSDDTPQDEAHFLKASCCKLAPEAGATFAVLKTVPGSAKAKHLADCITVHNGKPWSQWPG